MEKGLSELSSREYPGRVIILGCEKKQEDVVVIYVITGRSCSSQARRIEVEDNSVLVKPLDIEVIKDGNIDLLIYV